MKFGRKIHPGFGKIVVPKVDSGIPPSAHIHNTDPCSPSFDDGYVPSARGVVDYLLRVQMSRYGKTILDTLPRVALQRHASKLVKEHGVDVIARSVRRVANVTGRPFSFKLVSLFVEEIETCLKETK